jgi:hypothetical protein|tara:strand:+ start:100 stop:297 length:198 start_codon:yes stop_codon:yes gene_type:complete
MLVFIYKWNTIGEFMEKVYLIKNGVVVHTSNPNLFLADGWTHKHNNPEAKKPVGRKYGKKKKTTK